MRADQPRLYFFFTIHHTFPARHVDLEATTGEYGSFWPQRVATVSSAGQMSSVGCGKLLTNPNWTIVEANLQVTSHRIQVNRPQIGHLPNWLTRPLPMRWRRSSRKNSHLDDQSLFSGAHQRGQSLGMLSESGHLRSSPSFQIIII